MWQRLLAQWFGIDGVQEVEAPRFGYVCDTEEQRTVCWNHGIQDSPGAPLKCDQRPLGNL